jgi:hypothetical protein
VVALTAALPLSVAVGGCGGSAHTVAARPAALDPSYIPLPFGRGPRYRPPALNVRVALASSIGGLACRAGGGQRYGAHVELFARRRVIAIPAGIGVAPPQRHDGAYVRGGRCSYPLRTLEPTGVIELTPGPTRTLRDFFAVWGQPLSTRRLLSFRGPVLAFVDGRAWSGDPGAIALGRHAQIVLEVDGALPPHRLYRFAQGL